MTKRQCAKCRDRKHWSPAEEFKGKYWHWYLWKGQTTALAKKCMLAEPAPAVTSEEGKK